jgi:hypothetical protein
VRHIEGVTDVNPALAITSWHEVIDMPDNETLQDFDGYNDTIDDLLWGYGSHWINKVRTTDGRDIPEKEAIEQGIVGEFHTYQCDKLGGWPDFEQGDETPEDSEGNRMEFLMQIGHEGLIFADIDLDGIDWPTWGRGHIFASAATGEFAYVWACD